MEERKITFEQYIKEYQPLAGWVLIEKYAVPASDVTKGGIIIPDSCRTNKSQVIKWSNTGIIRKKSLFTRLENDWENYFYSLISEGDHVGFSSEVPYISPAPSNYDFIDATAEDIVRFVTIQAVDIMCILTDTEGSVDKYISRYKE